MLRLDVEAQQAAFDGTVVHRVRAFRLDLQLSAERRVAGQHGGLPADIQLAQFVAEQRVEALQPLRLPEPFAVRRIHGQQAVRRRRWRQVCELAALGMDVLREAGARRIVERRADRCGLTIVGTKQHALDVPRGAPLGRLGQQALPERLVVAAPAQEAELVAQQTRRDVGRDQRSLDREAAGTAHRVDEPKLAVGRANQFRPAGPQQQRCRQILFQRCGALCAAIAAPMETLAREIDRDAGDVAVEVQIQPHVGSGNVDGRPASRALAKLVDDGVFDFQRGELRVRDLRTRARALDGQRPVDGEVLAPVDRAHAVIERFGGWRGKLGDP
jgi:hypothetical protein